MEHKEYNNAVNSIYPFVNSYTHKDTKVSPKELSLMIKRFHELSKVYESKLEKNDYKHVKNIFIRLMKFTRKIFKIASRRNDIDISLGFSTTFQELAEIIMFTSAVNLGIFLSSYNLSSKKILILGGLLGLLLHFSQSIFNLIKNSYINISKINMVGENVFSKYRYIQKVYNVKDVLKNDEDFLLEEILLHGKNKNSDFRRIIDAIIYYKVEIYDNDIDLLYQSGASKEIISEVESFVDTVVNVFIVALVSVENRDPLPGDKNLLRYLSDPMKIGQIIGYVLLNTLSFNLLTSYFSSDAYLLFFLNLSVGLIVILVLYIIQKLLRKRMNDSIPR